MKKRKIFSIGLGVFLAAIYMANASWIAGEPDGEMTLLAHRGVHQTFSSEDLKNDTCTAARIDAPSHNYIENTLPSIQAAIDMGADIIEIDIHPTIDGDFVVFHDWTLECRTNGKGRTRDHSLSELKALDIGYGYTADGGASYPFRGKFEGVIQSLNDVLNAFPVTTFNLNLKSRSAREAESLMSYLEPRCATEWQRLILNGHPAPLNIIRAAKPSSVTYSKPQAKDCAMGYMKTGWFGKIPKACHNTIVPVPINYRRVIWGWPHRFETRLNAVGSRSMLIGPLDEGVTTGIDALEQAALVPDDYKGIVFTNKIEVIGPELSPH